jgi:acyl-CoA synthetase (AMP-forming)/AMP-acid ligase II
MLLLDGEGGGGSGLKPWEARQHTRLRRKSTALMYSEAAAVATSWVAPAKDGSGGSVVLRAGHTLSEAAVIEFCRHGLADYKRPRKVTFLAELPRNPTGKVLKRDLRVHA